MHLMMVYDSERCARLNALIGCMILTILREPDHLGQHTTDSKFPELGHVIALYLLWSISANETRIKFEDLSDDDDAGAGPENVDWQEILAAYAASFKLIKLFLHGNNPITVLKSLFN